MFFIVANFITVKLSNLYVITTIKLLTIRCLYQHLVFRDALKSIVDSESQTDPRFEDTRLFTRLTPENIKMQLHKKGYRLEDLPTNQTIYNKVNELGYSFSTVQKTKPLKKIAETDAIFKKNKASQ
jgi:hypothetical protein